jgi:transposase
MREPYKSVADAAIPNASACMDPFRAAENASKAMNDIRKTAGFGSKEEG